MRTLFRIFNSAPGGRPWLVVLAFFLASLTEGIGLVTLLPVIAIVGGESDPSGTAKVILDKLAEFGIQPDLNSLIGVFILMMVLKASITFLATQFISNTAAEVATNIRRQVISGIMRARWQFIIESAKGQFPFIVSGESNRAADAYLTSTTFIALVAQTAINLLVALYLSWKLALAGVALGLIVAGALGFLVPLAKKAGKRETFTRRALISELTDALHNLKPLRAMGRETAYEQLLRAQVEKVRRAMRRQILYREGLTGLNEILIAVGFAAIILTAPAVMNVGFETLAIMAVALARTANNIGKLQKTYQRVAMLESAYIVTGRLLDDLSVAAEERTGGRQVDLSDGIRFDHVSLQHGDVQALQDVSFKIKAKDLTVIVGPSGAGKTSIIDLALRLYEPSAGSIAIDGIELGELDISAWRNRVGYVAQELMLLHDTIYNNVTFGDPSVTEEDVARALELAGAAGFVATLPQGLATEVGSGGAKLSGGQRQRIALARALARRPDLLIFDEATSALDRATAQAISAEVERLKGLVTIIVITHRGEFLDIADHLIRIESGRIIEQSTPNAANAGGDAPDGWESGPDDATKADDGPSRAFIAPVS